MNDIATPVESPGAIAPEARSALEAETRGRFVVIALSILLAIELHKLLRPDEMPQPEGGPT